MKYVKIASLLLFVFGAGIGVGARLTPPSQDMGHANELYKSPSSGTMIRMLLDERNLGGGEVEVAEITFEPGANSGSHPHGSTEIFYVLSGELEHVVGGESHLLKAGDIGFVRPPDHVNHIVPGNEPVKALVIWAPGGEGARIISNWEKQ